MIATATKEEHAIQKALAAYLTGFDYLYCEAKKYGLIVTFHDMHRIRRGQVRIHVDGDTVAAVVWSPKNTSKEDEHTMDEVWIDLHDPDSFDEIRRQFDFRWQWNITYKIVSMDAPEHVPYRILIK